MGRDTGDKSGKYRCGLELERRGLVATVVSGRTVFERLSMTSSKPPRTPAELLEEIRKLKQELAGYRSISDSMTDYVMRYDRDGRHVFANRAALEVTGLPAEQYIGKTHEEMGFPPHLCELWGKNIKAVFDTGQSKEVEFKVDLVDGITHLLLSLHPEFDDEGEVVNVLGISRDISETRKGAEELKLRGTMLANMSEGVFLSRTSDDTIIFCNNQFEDMLGYGPDEIVGKSANVVFSETVDAKRLREEIQSTLATDQVWRGELLIAGKGGSELWCHVSISEFAHPTHGTIWIAVHRDVSAAKAIESQRILMARELDHRVKNNIAGIVSLLQQTAQSSANLEEFLPTFRGRLEAMAFVHETLARSSWSEIDLAGMMQSTLSQFAEEKVEVEGPSAMLPATTAMPLGMALHELAMNAAKYGALSRSDGTLQVRWLAPNPGACIEVEWVEQVGAPLRIGRKGLGLRLVEGLVRHEIGGTAELRETATGLQWRFEIPREGAA